MHEPFDIRGKFGTSPVCISVPHAGRSYPGDIAEMLAMPLSRARGLEDRHADVLAQGAAGSSHTVIIARTPRLLIDLNRAETDFDPAAIEGGVMGGARPTFRARGGLGLIPDRMPGAGALWRRRPTLSVLTERISAVHRPYHAVLAEALHCALRVHGFAVLIDLHSMPPLTGPSAPDIVIGDLNGLSAAPDIVDAAHAVFADSGLSTARNMPYAGGYVLERHARPAGNVHALQIEIDRRLYLDSKLDMPGNGAARMIRAVSALADRLAKPDAGVLIAAE